MVQYAFTPWRDRHELLAVRRQFYPSLDGHPATSTRDHRLLQQNDSQHHAAAAAHAVSRVSSWMQRGQCPHMIESTALLVAAGLSELSSSTSSSSSPPSTSPTSLSSSSAARAAYAAAFSRFVTGLLDGQQDRARKLSMYSLARSIGLPASFVELRHQATHESLPSLARLRVAARRALLWIWHYYWVHLGGERSGESREGGEGEESRESRGSSRENKRAQSDEEEQPEVSSGDSSSLSAALLRLVDSDIDASSAPSWDVLSPLIQTWGEAAVLSALAAGPGLDPEADCYQQRVRRCLRLSQVVLQHSRRGQAVSKPKPASQKTVKQPKTTAGKIVKTTPPQKWTLDNLDLDAMRASLERDRQALYESSRSREEEKEEEEKEEEEEEEKEEEEKEEENGQAEDVAMADGSEPDDAPHRPRWTLYEGDWIPRPIGVA